MTQSIGRARQRVAFALISLFLAAAAQAGVVYTGHFDPPGNDINIPGFTGDAVFDIANDCFALGNGWHSSGYGEGYLCSPSYMTSAIVNLYSIIPTDPIVGPPRDSFTLGNFSVFGVLIKNGQLAGVDTNPMGPARGQDYYSSPFFWLQFKSGCINNNGCIDPAYLLVNSTNDPNTASHSDPATVTFKRVTSVPEPGTLSLILAAAGLGWLGRRRHKTAA